jgi:putative transposase
MARANRHFIPGGVWHITHRCHKKDFLLKFAQDRTRFVAWVREARKRFGLQVLNYTVTSNHVHLLVKDSGDANSIPAAIQLVAGRTGQEYNHRKRRKGAFWEDRYHATAIESGEHLRRCLVYIDLNMVRAGVVKHPKEWVHGGYHEIQGQRRRNTILALDVLAEAVEVGSQEELARAHREWIEEALRSERRQREEFWSKSVAVGSEEFVIKTQQMLGMRGKGRDVVSVGDSFLLRESHGSYGVNFTPENRPIALENAHYWDDYP